MKIKYIYYIVPGVLLLSVLSLIIFNFANKRIPLLKISHNSEIVSPWGWKIISFNKHKGLGSYYFIKNDHDTTISFSFEYFSDNRYNKQGLGSYDLIKEYKSGNSMINISLTIYGDTLYINERPDKKSFFSIKYGHFIKGKYFYYYKMEKHELDSCQIHYFEHNKDSLIKVGANDIPIFNERCEIIK
jgi:hypothetical protein